MPIEFIDLVTDKGHSLHLQTCARQGPPGFAFVSGGLPHGTNFRPKTNSDRNRLIFWLRSLDYPEQNPPTHTRTCPQCGTERDPEACAGLCPACFAKSEASPSAAAVGWNCPQCSAWTPGEKASPLCKACQLETLGQPPE